MVTGCNNKLALNYFSGTLRVRGIILSDNHHYSIIADFFNRSDASLRMSGCKAGKAMADTYNFTKLLHRIKAFLSALIIYLHQAAW